MCKMGKTLGNNPVRLAGLPLQRVGSSPTPRAKVSQMKSMKYSNKVGPDFFPRAAKRVSEKSKPSGMPSATKNGKWDVCPEASFKIGKKQSTQNLALINTSQELIQPTVKAQYVRITFRTEQGKVMKPEKVVLSESRKRINAMKAMYEKKLEKSIRIV
jgi:hypothetical protein